MDEIDKAFPHFTQEQRDAVRKIAQLTGDIHGTISAIWGMIGQPVLPPDWAKNFELTPSTPPKWKGMKVYHDRL